MNKSSLNAEFNQEKRKLWYWMSQWNNDQEICNEIEVDIPELSVLLQIIGYKVESIEKASEAQESSMGSNFLDAQSSSQVQITCSRSGLKSTFQKCAICKCPTNEEINKRQFWSVTGCSPCASQNSINSSTSSLIPTISNGKIEIITHLMSKIFQMIKDKEGENESRLNVSQNTYLTRHRSLDTLKTMEESSTTRNPSLKRGPSWEVDPKTTPPTGTSSPVPDLTHTLSRISIDSEKSHGIVKNLEEIKKIATETLELASSNSTYSKKIPKKRVSDIKPVETGGANPGASSSSPKTRIRLTPKRNINIPTPTALPTLRRIATGVGSPRPLQRGIPQSTPTPLKKGEVPGKVFKSTIATGSKMRTPSSYKPQLPSCSGLTKFKNLNNPKK